MHSFFPGQLMEGLLLFVLKTFPLEKKKKETFLFLITDTSLI